MVSHLSGETEKWNEQEVLQTAPLVWQGKKLQNRNPCMETLRKEEYSQM